MKRLKSLGVIFLVIIALGFTSCASSDKDAATEVQPTAEELRQAELEELSRMEQEELERMRQAEEVRTMDFDPSTVLSSVYFDFDKFNLSDLTRSTLGNNAEWIKMHPEVSVQVEGHCDERGTEEYNLALGEKRATAAKAYLVSLGVDESQIYTISYGEERPESEGHDESAWSQNRRAAFMVNVK